MAVLLHFRGGTDDGAALLRCVSALASALSQHTVPLALVLECATALDAGLFQALQPLASKAGSPLLVAQPAQLPFFLRSALAQLGPPQQHVLAVSLSAAPAALFAAAAALQCAVLALPAAAPGGFVIAVLQHLAALLRRQTGCLVCGYVMKRSRVLSLSVEGMLPLAPRGGLCFMPLDPSLTLAAQQPFDILLQKPTDYLEEVAGSGRVPGFTTQMVELNTHLAALPHICVVDPLSRVQTVMDRAALAALLDGVCPAARRAGVPLRSPRWVVLPALGRAPVETQAQLEGAGIQPPLIIKPQVACGVPESHQMALVLHWEGLRGLEVPLPAVAQEYIDHGGLVWKVYVAGDKVFMVQRKSTPDLHPLARHLEADPAAEAPTTVNFDSLKSLPTALPWARQLEAQQPAAGGSGAQQGRQLQQRTAEVVAGLLREKLLLTLFGFDIVISDAGELVIIDVNFFPSFKGHPEAPEALRAALLARHAAWRAAHT